jgi:hypothetical protein
MMGEYLEVFAAFNGRGRALLASNWSISSGSNSGFVLTFGDIDELNSIHSCRLISEDIGPTHLGMKMDDYSEVFAAWFF